MGVLVRCPQTFDYIAYIVELFLIGIICHACIYNTKGYGDSVQPVMILINEIH